MHSDPTLVLATLLENGLALEPAENLPLEWRAAYEAMRSVRGGLYERRAALEAALQDDPLAIHKMAEIEEAIPQITAEDIGQLRIYSAWETVTEPPKLDWVVNGLFTRPSLNLIVGAPGSKKTWLALDLAVCAASGRTWLGKESQPTPTLIVDEEGGLPRVWDRLHRVMAGRQATPKIPLYFVSMAGHNFALPNEVTYLSARANYLKAGLIIIDALVNVMSGTDENNVLSVQPILASLRRLAQNCNAAVVVVHHTNKQGIFRGSTLIASGVDHMLGVESPAQDPLIQITTLKARDLEPVTITAKAHFENSQFWLSQEESANQQFTEFKPSYRSVLNFIATHPRATTPELMESLSDSSPSTIRQAVHELAAAGYITRVDGGTRGQIAAFEISKKGAELVENQ